ncbi:MAG: ArsR family transcriptional regulator [Methanothrix sp.]|nr:ArsR family transcriptional regulator [Methanothrix sp.]
MSPDETSQDRGWQGAEGHRFALEVLQLPLRRRMLRLMASGMNAAQQMGAELNLSSPLVEYHLSMLEKALVIERHEAGWRVTSTGLLFLEKVEGGL